MKTTWLVAVALLVPLFQLRAGPVPSEAQSREWTEPNPQVVIHNSDKYIDYKRDAKTVYRVIDRVTHVKPKATDPDDPKPGVTTRYIEFVFDDKVFASVRFDNEGRVQPTLQVGEGVFFSVGRAGPSPFDPSGLSFHVCVPKYNYYEYVEIIGKEVTAGSETDNEFARRKQAFIKMAEKGYLSKLSDEKSD